MAVINEVVGGININAGGINEIAEVINTKVVVVIYFSVRINTTAIIINRFAEQTY